MRVYELRGERREDLLDWLHVHAAVLGVVEEVDAVVVWLDGELPAHPFVDATVSERVVDLGAPAATGLEQDTVIDVAPGLVVRPPWVEPRPGFVGIELVLPRGGAFGSGEHGSTKAALTLLHRHWDEPGSFGDVGTGSGILLLYARARGCTRLAGCDIDAPSVRAAAELLPSAALTVGGPATMPRVDGLVANMTGDELTAALPAMLGLWTGQSRLVFSGLRTHEVEPFLQRLRMRPFDRATVGAFTALVFEPQPVA
jgi:ribosomal protein L11 methyltransferase